ncbi:MAG: HD domain-containing protein [Methanomicrobiales archaeon]|nr:HD domain-containing protein [Methanomicrobiales archaeon]
MKFIKDPVHGYVEVPESLLPLLDAPPVQRLRHIRQLGFSYLVYPGANHTRFEHALGAMHLARLMGSHLGLGEGGEGALVTAAALLHDVGHGPFSHTTEPLMRESAGRRHDEIGPLLSSGPLAGPLEGAGLDPGEVAAVIRGSHPLSPMIHGDLDVDRMDYLQRDAHYTGVPYGTVDAPRLIKSCILEPEGMVIDENGINAAESLLIARTLMRPAVYYHHVSRIASSMLLLALQEHLEGAGAAAVAGLLSLDDSGLLQALAGSASGTARDLAGRLSLRRLYKRAVYVGADQVNAQALQSDLSLRKMRRLGMEIAEGAGRVPAEVIVDIPPVPADIMTAVRVRWGGTDARLEDISPLVHTLNRTRRVQWRMGVYTVPGAVSDVARVATDVLHVKRVTTQDRLVVD